MLSMYASKNVKLYINPHEPQVMNQLLINWVKKFKISKWVSWICSLNQLL